MTHQPETARELASLAVNAGRALQDEKRHYEIACQENARLRAALERIHQMTDYWEQHLPEVIRTPAVVSALRAAMERAEPVAVSAAVAPPTQAALDAARATNQRLNRRAQQLESELATYRRAVDQWEISERGTYIPHSSLRTIGKACGVDILGSVRHLKHFERVEQAEAENADLRARLAVLEGQATPPTDPTHGLSVPHADALWDAVAIPGPHTPTYPEQHERVCRAVRDILDELTPARADADARTALRDRIADTLATADGWVFAPGFKEGSPTYQGFLRQADAVLAVLPEPTTRAAVYREAADDLATAFGDPMAKHIGALGASHLRRRAREIEAGQRRMADEPATQTPHTCDNCEGVDPDTCINNPNRPPEQCPRSEFDGYGLQCQKPAGHNLCTFEEQPAAGARQDGTET